jgi:cell division protein FtsB
MRFQFLALLCMTLAGAGTFWYRTTQNICPVPLPYHIASIAPEFNLSKEKAKSYLVDAEKVWETETGRELFYYTEDKGVAVNFVFDERQAMAEAQQNQKSALDKQKTDNQSLFATIDDLRKQYETDSKSYQEKVSAYEKKLNAYNDKVNGYNDRGGAPSDVFASLEKEKAALSKESNSLNSTSDKLNELAKKINELSQKSGQLVDAYNSEVKQYNNEFGFSREFTQGDYQDKVINIYKFSTDNEVRKVLAHELGHALGLNHVDGDSSIMYYLLKDTSSAPTLSSEDRAAFVALCGTGNEFSFKARFVIRSFLAKFK